MEKRIVELGDEKEKSNKISKFSASRRLQTTRALFKNEHCLTHPILYYKALNNCDNRLCFVKNNLSLTFLPSTPGVNTEVSTVIFQPRTLRTPAFDSAMHMDGE